MAPLFRVAGELFLALVFADLAIATCGQTKNQEAPPLARRVSPEVRQLIEDLNSTDPVTRANAAVSLGDMGDNAIPAIPYLVNMLHDDVRLQWKEGLTPGEGTSPSGEAQEALAKIGEPAFEQTIQFCYDAK